MEKILVTGAAGQIGSELAPALQKKFGEKNVIITSLDEKHLRSIFFKGILMPLDATNRDLFEKIIIDQKITQIYHLAGILSAAGEKNPDLAWKVNAESLKIALDLAVKHKINKVFWPSSIASFGPTTPRDNTPQQTILEPTTMYGVTKVLGELLCQYYFLKYGLDVRSLRYPGIISWKTEPGGGTTDYAVAIFYEGIKCQAYDCYLREDTVLPMMYMDDAIAGTIKLMDAPKENIKIRTSYNFTAVSFDPQQIYREIKKYIPNFKIVCHSDARQKIADSWPKSIDDSAARRDWNWQHKFDLAKITDVMIQELKKKLG